MVPRAMASRFADLMRSLTISPAGGSAGMRHSAAGKGTGSTLRCYRQRGTRTVRLLRNKKSQERKPGNANDIPTDTKKRAPSSRVLQEVIRRAPPEYVTVGWLTSTLPHSFGIIMLCLGLLATTPVGSTVPGIILAIMAVQLIVGRAEPVFPAFYHDATLAD
jgi:hypothetical protein